MTLEDVCLWPDGSWCFFEDIMEMSHMSDDYEVISAGSDRWFIVTEGNVDVEESSFNGIDLPYNSTNGS